MAKKAYSKPMLKSEAFVPQSYVAACGDSGTDYYFKCDAGGGVSGYVWLETNGVPGLQENKEWVGTGTNWWEGHLVEADKFLDGYQACNTTHTASSSDEFPLGYFKANSWGSTAIEVRVWTEGGTNVHCTENLNQSTWQTAKS